VTAHMYKAGVQSIPVRNTHRQKAVVIVGARRREPVVESEWSASHD
jgi:hypothetical protein